MKLSETPVNCCVCHRVVSCGYQQVNHCVHHICRRNVSFTWHKKANNSVRLRRRHELTPLAAKVKKIGLMARSAQNVERAGHELSVEMQLVFLNHIETLVEILLPEDE